MVQLPEKGPYCKELLWIFKKLVLVLTTSVLVTDDGEKVDKVLYIYYPVWF